MSMLRNWLTYMGLGPDEDYDDSYLYDPDGADEFDDDDERYRDARSGSGSGENGSRSSRTGRNPSRPSRARSDEIDEIDLRDDSPRGVNGRGSSSAARSDERSRSGERVRNSIFDTTNTFSHSDLFDDDDDIFGDDDEFLPSVPRLRAVEGGGGRAEAANSEGNVTRVSDATAGALEERGSGVGPRLVDPKRSEHAPGDANPFDVEERIDDLVSPVVMVPTDFSEAKSLADNYKRLIPVVLNLRVADRHLSQEMIAFASGVVYVTDGSMKKLASGVFLIAPRGIDISTADRESLKANGYQRVKG